VADEGSALASVIDWLQTPASALHGAEAAAGGTPGQADGPSRRSFDPLASEGADATALTAGQATPLATDDAHADVATEHLAEPAPPVALAQGLAARGKGSGTALRGTERPTTLMLQNGDSIQWRSTSATQPEGMPATSAAALTWSTARSTVALHHRFGLSQDINQGAARSGEAASAGPMAPGGAAGTQTGDAAMGQRQGAGAADGGALGTSDETPSADEVTDFAAPPSGTETEEANAQDLRTWTPGSLRQASLRVGQDGEEAIDIELSLRGQEVNIDFRTDNAEARSSLQASAGQTLSELLQRSGMQLGGLSVGGQAVPDRQSPGQEATPSRRPDQARAVSGGGEAAAALPRLPRSDGKSSLDLFV
jgi:flagellar hook-length control protein FliK